MIPYINSLLINQKIQKMKNQILMRLNKIMESLNKNLKICYLEKIIHKRNTIIQNLHFPKRYIFMGKSKPKKEN